jgi:hypothetical protein
MNFIFCSRLADRNDMPLCTRKAWLGAVVPPGGVHLPEAVQDDARRASICDTASSFDDCFFRRNETCNVFRIEFKMRFADLGGTVLPGSSAEFGKLIAEETEKWAKVIKFSGIKAGIARTYRRNHSYTLIGQYRQRNDTGLVKAG